MSTPNSHSLRRHFGYDADRSNVIRGIYFFKYLHPFRHLENEESDGKIHSESIFVVVGSYEITLKLEVLVYSKNEVESPIENSLSSTQFEDLLTIPLDTKHNNFAEIETQLIRLKQKELKKERLKNKQGKSTFEQILQHFIEDLYVHNYFKETGDVQKLKSALEHVPLIQGIIRKFLFDYYYEDCVNFRKKDIRTDYKIRQFESAYLNYSRFLSMQENERLFRQGGWFVDKHNKKESNIDNELANNVEKRYSTVYHRFGGDGFLVSPLKNTRHILTRYGIVDILKLALPRPIANLFVPLLGLVVAFIFAYIGIFQYASTQLERNSTHKISESLSVVIHQGLLWSAVTFFAYTTFVFFWLLARKKKQIILPGLFLPRMTIAIIAALWTLLINESLFKVDMDVDGKLLLFIGVVVFLIILSFMIFEINNYAPAMIFWKRVRRSLVVVGLAFVTAFSFGFWTTSYINRKHMSVSSHFLVKESKFVKEFEVRERLYKAKLAEIERHINENNGKDTIKPLEINNIPVLAGIPVIDTVNGYFTKIIDAANDTNNTQGDLTNKLHDLDSLLSKSAVYYFRNFLEKNQYIEINETKVHYKQHNIILLGKLTIFPNMLLSRTLLAMFIGIFLQLMTRGKPITEPI